MKTYSHKLALATLVPLCAVAFAPLTLAENTKPATTQTPNAQPAAAPERLVCNHARILPRKGFPQAVKGAIIQGSNSGPTEDFVDLATVTEEAQDGKWLEVKFDNNKVYRFLRYFAPKDSWFNVAEIQFLHDDTKLTGAVFGIYGSKDNGKNTYNKAFDSDPATYFEAPMPSDVYAGIELLELPSANPPVATKGGERMNGARCHFHIGNSLTDTEGEYTQQIAKAAGYEDDTVDRASIPGSPIHYHWSRFLAGERPAFGTPPGDAAEKYAPVSDLIEQVFVQNGDTSNPTPIVGFYDLFKTKSPGVRLWIYGQWWVKDPNALWEQQGRALDRVYLDAAMNAQKMRPLNPPVAVIPGGFALIGLKRVVENGKLPGVAADDFFAKTFDDGIHLSDMGRYFIGLVHYACIYDKSPVGIPPIPLGKDKHLLSPELTAALEQIAWEGVKSWKEGNAGGNPVPGEVCAGDYIGNISHNNGTVSGNGYDSGFGYFLSAPSDGKYLFSVEGIITAAAPEGPSIMLNGEPAGRVEFPDMSEKMKALGESKPMALQLKKGLNKLQLTPPLGSGYRIDRLRITDSKGGGIKHSLPFCDAMIYGITVEPDKTAEATFHVSDDETPAGEIKVTAFSGNPAVLPPDAISVETIDGGTRKIVLKHPGKPVDTTLGVIIANNAGLSRYFTFRVKCN